ncbi:MAG: hypothetical protein U5J63_06810 [Fodinibius sp.]|nr:hypothetical protein [Fodinibius sp.]
MILEPIRESYCEDVKEMVNKAINETKLSIDDVAESSYKTVTVYSVSTNQRVGNQHVAQERQGVCGKIAHGVIKVEVENPEYHYTGPDYQKEDDTRLLMPVFDKNAKSRETSEEFT